MNLGHRGVLAGLLMLALAAGCGKDGEPQACGPALPACPTSFVCGADGRCRFDTGNPDLGEPDAALPPGVATIAPSTIRVPVGRNHYFRVASADAGAITWSILEAGGGTIEAVGKSAEARDAEYRAPLVAGTYTVVADVASDPPARATATVEVIAYEVELLAGATGGSGFADGIGAEARTGTPYGMTSDGTYLYFADSSTIRRIAIASRTVETIAGARGITGSADGVGSAARFNNPIGLTHVAGALYISDSNNHTIRRLDLTSGAVTTIAGGVAQPGAIDGIGGAARFSNPIGLAAADGELYIVDSGNHVVRKLTLATGAVVRLAGTFGGTTTNTSSATELYQPVDVVVDGTQLYVSDAGGHTVRRINRSTGAISLVAGAYNTAGFVPGAAASARFDSPRGLAITANKLYVIDRTSLRSIDLLASDAVALVAGSATTGATDGTGAVATFSNPFSVGSSGGVLYVADSSNALVRQVSLAGEVTTFIGKAASGGNVDGAGAAARLSFPERMLIDGDNLYFGDAQTTIRRVALSTAMVSTLAGSAGVFDEVDEVGGAARFAGVSGVALRGVELYIVGRNRKSIRRLTLANNAVTTIVPPNDDFFGFAVPDLAIDVTGTIYFSSRTKLGKASTAGGTSMAVGDLGTNLGGLAYVGSQLYAADRARHVILRVDPTVTPLSSTVVAGEDGVPGNVDGLGGAARFSGPVSLVRGPEGLLYVTDGMNATVRRLDPETGAVTTLFGRAGISMVKPGPVSEATLNAPMGIAVSAEGEVVVSNQSEHCLSRLKRP